MDENRLKSVDPDFLAQLNGYALTTAEITYRMPDARALLQVFTWQDYDMAPKFPKLERFLDFWDRELEGPIHSVRVAHAQLLSPTDIRHASEYRIH
ncbi:MAG: usg protein [Neomegalonema sp.]|nr:usg protein [Neomegalonema sp.]